MNILKQFILISILSIFSCSAHADNNQSNGDYFQEEEHLSIFGDWTVNIVFFPEWNPLFKIFKGSQVFQIETKNKQGNALGIMCSGGDTGRCVPYVNLNSYCENSNQYNALISTDASSSCVSMECTAITSLYYLFLLPETHVDYILSGNKYGMAYEKKDGLFKSSFFSLNGSTKAFLEGKKLLANFPLPEKEVRQGLSL